MLKCKPFVKWAGGKRSILKELKKHAPNEYDTYYEPFLGGGALLFELSPKKAVINDINEELMNVFKCLKDEDKFSKMCKLLNNYEVNHSEKFYYEIRELDRNKDKYSSLADYKKAARTIYLNKSCFNGLYRVNSKNEFNVPFNKKSSINTYDGQNLSLIHAYLNFNDIKVLNEDFESVLKNAKKGDFVYIDPPYDSDIEIFTSYTENGFDKNEQRRLARVFKELDEKGVYVMLSNYNTELIRNLYSDYNKHIIHANRNINSKGDKRGIVEELIITNY